MATYNNLDQLYKALGKQIEVSLSKTANDVMELAKGFIMTEFYNQYPNPKSYQRTYDLLESVTKTKVSHTGNTYTVEVYLDPTSARGYADDDPLLVWNLAAAGIHGNTGVEVTKGRFWETTKKEFFDNYKKYLIKHGLNVI